MGALDAARAGDQDIKQKARMCMHFAIAFPFFATSKTVSFRPPIPTYSRCASPMRAAALQRSSSSSSLFVCTPSPAAVLDGSFRAAPYMVKTVKLVVVRVVVLVGVEW